MMGVLLEKRVYGSLEIDTIVHFSPKCSAGPGKVTLYTKQSVIGKY